MKNKTVYVGISADILHEGHINILKFASKYGKVVVGLLTDEAIATYKKFPYLDYRQREIVLKNIKYVEKVIPQTTHDYTNNLLKVRPNYVVHGDDWREGLQKKIRQKVLKAIKKWSGKLIETPYTKNISSSKIKTKIYKVGTTPQNRVSRLKRLADVKKIVVSGGLLMPSAEELMYSMDAIVSYSSDEKLNREVVLTLLDKNVVADLVDSRPDKEIERGHPEWVGEHAGSLKTIYTSITGR